MSDLTLIPSRFRDVVPSDTNAINIELGLYCGSAGVVKVVGRDSVTATFNVTAGQTLKGKFNFVLATGTTATGLVGLFAF